MNNKLSIQIYGTKYNLTTSENPTYVEKLGEEIDEVVTNLMRSGGVANVNEALVLAALSFIDSYKKADEGADNLRRQITEYAEDVAKARMELTEARKELARLQGDRQKG